MLRPTPSKPMWLTIHSQELCNTGELCLRKNIQIRMTDFGSPFFKTNIPLIKILDISQTEVSSLEGLPYLPHLNTFNADSTNIASFINIKSIKHASKVSFKHTPISAFKNYKLSLLLIFGIKLISIDGRMVSKALLEKCSKYPKCASELINRGWVAESPCPNNNRFYDLCISCGINDDFKDDSSTSTSLSSSTIADSFENIMKEYHEKQAVMFQAADPIFQPSTQKGIDEKLFSTLSQMLSKHGITIEDENRAALLEEIEGICKKAIKNIGLKKSSNSKRVSIQRNNES